MNNLVQVDIITIVRNSANSIINTLDSISNQGYSQINHIIIDGNSQDCTVDIINRYHHSKKNRLFQQNGIGIANAFNEGLSQSSGDLVIFLNSGDTFFDKSVVAKIVDSYVEIEWDWAFGETISVSKHRLLKRHIKQYSHWNQRLFLYNNPICHQSTIFSRGFIEQVGSYNENLSIGMDYDFNIRAALIAKPYLLYFPISYYDTTGVSSIKVFKGYQSHIELRAKYFPSPNINSFFTDFICLLKAFTRLTMIPAKLLM